jgi:uncharacterized protein YjiS (DUF1127 family)
MPSSKTREMISMFAAILRAYRPLPRGYGSRVATWVRRSRTRKALRDLDARQLADIGVSEPERAAECGKWFWQV